MAGISELCHVKRAVIVETSQKYILVRKNGFVLLAVKRLHQSESIFQKRLEIAMEHKKR